MPSFKKHLRNPLNALYEEANLPGDIRKSLNFIAAANICGNIWGIICGSTTTAMVGLATLLHANDLAFGIINAIVQAAAFMQIPFSILVNRTQKRKKYILTYGVFSRALWMLFGLIPLIIPDTGGFHFPLWTLIFLLGISSCCGSMINVCWFPWFSDLAPVSIRGRWLSLRDTIIAAVNIAAGLGVAFLLDNLPVENRYIIVFLIGGAIGICDMLAFGFCKEVYPAAPKKLHILPVLKEIWQNRPFVRFMLMWTVWCFTANMCGVFLVPYAMNFMGLNAMQIMIFATIAACVGTILTVSRWGKAMFHYGSKSVMMVSCVLTALTPLFFLFSTPGNIWPTLLHNLLGAMFWCGCNLAANTMQLSFSTDETRPSYIAVFSCITCLAGTTLGSLTGGFLLDFMEQTSLFTGFFDRYKALILLATILRLASVFLLVPRLSNDHPGTAKDLVHGILRTVHHHR